MSSLAPPFEGQRSGRTLAPARELTSDVLRRRAGRRRQMLSIQAASYALNSSVLLIYAYAGTLSIAVPSAYFLGGMMLTGFFVALSETHVNDRFEDHYLTIAQIGANIALQLGFLLAAPEIGYAFLSFLFLTFGFGALRMTANQAIIAWCLTAIGVIPAFVFASAPIGMPVATPLDRMAAMLSFVITIGQCAFVGLYGSSLRNMLYNRSVELRSAYQRIEELAELDELTGTFNRRCIMRMLEDEIARAHRNKTACSIALIDLDLFKRINDAHGHPTGDEVLRTFAITTFANIRNIDKFGRYGGEEFLLVLPDTPNEAAVRSLDRLRAIIAELDWSALSAGMAVTISAGVATLVADETPDALLARADCALYSAKECGRNRIARA
jgi:diguanylate cyclase (GGDEF)-like protein